MVSSYTTNITLEKPGNNDYVDTWNVPVNGDMDIIDQAIGGNTPLNVVSVSGNVTLTVSQYRSRTITISGLQTANITYRFPSGVGGFWFVQNAASGAFTITFSSLGGGTTVAIPQGTIALITCDGTNVRSGDNQPSGAGGSSGQVQFNSSGLLAGSSSLTWNGSTLTAPTFAGTLIGSATSVANTLTINASNAGGSPGSTFNGSSALTISRNTIGAAGSGVNTDISALNITGGLVIGSPSGGAQGTGTINAQALYINGVAASAGSGSVTSVAASGGTTGLSFSGSPITTSGTFTLSGTLAVTNGGTGGTSQATARTGLGLGTMATQNASAVAITGGTISGVSGLAASGSNTDITSLAVGSGTAGTPSYGFSGNAGTGIYSSGASTVNIAAGSSSRLSVSTSAVISTLPLVLPSGTSPSAPALRLTGDATSGLYSSSTGQIGISSGGTALLRIGLGGNSIECLNSAKFVLSGGNVPATAGATGAAGEITFDSSYMYMCIATNTWKRAAISTW